MASSGRSKNTQKMINGASRQLSKKDLGGAIFGCKNDTIQECLNKQLFGLPSSHFHFVKNIQEGLPLFLFNYSDRRMHGIYAAASEGQMSIDPYAWTNCGAEKTSFPAQVRIYVSMQCLPLVENQFKKVIFDNYYKDNHFYFELDHGQMKGLQSLFKPLPIPGIVKQAHVTPTKTKSLLPIEASRWIPIGKNEHIGPIVYDIKQPKASIDYSNRDTSQSLVCKKGYMELGSSSKESISTQESGDCTGQHIELGGIDQHIELGDIDRHNLATSETGIDIKGKKILSNLCDEGLDNRDRLLNKLHGLCLERSGLTSKVYNDDNVVQCMASDVCIAWDSLLTKSLVPSEMVKKETVSCMQEKSELLQIIGELNERTTILEKKLAARDKEVGELRSLVEESGRTIHIVENRLMDLESQLNASIPLGGGTPSDIYVYPKDVIYLIGGFDGTSASSSLDAFSPSEGKLRTLKAMGCPRSYASAVALDNNIFVFGGGTGDSKAWYSTVECYCPRDNKWTLCSPLNRAKGSLGGARIDHKIFAIGGGDNDGPVSEVEMFDSHLGKWLRSSSLIHKRFATAAVELAGTLYAVGGYDGDNYLMSAERYDPREGYWVKISNMNTRRGCHSLSVFNQKIYAIGGYDGDEMVSSVEFFDPRAQTWIISEPMNLSRGYAAAAVLNDALYIIGGLTTQDSLWENVECYREGAGWSFIPSGEIRKRCFLSAAVL